MRLVSILLLLFHITIYDKDVVSLHCIYVLRINMINYCTGAKIQMCLLYLSVSVITSIHFFLGGEEQEPHIFHRDHNIELCQNVIRTHFI